MKKVMIFSLILSLTVLFTGCAKISDGGGFPKVGSNHGESVNPPVERDETVRPSGEKNDGLVAANQQFSWDIFKKLNEEDSEKELFISPFSISAMLTMALNGAEGTTKEAILKGLHYSGMSREALNNGYAFLMNRLQTLDPKVTMEIANSIWVRQGFEVKQDFVDVNRDFLSAEIKLLDFDLPEAAEEINQWISEKTRRLIPKMIDPPIKQDVMMYLINAIYFKGEWASAFEEKNTSEEDFHALDGETDRIPMMCRSGKVEYVKTEEYQAVSLPYGNGNTSMIVILPDEDINHFVEGMNQKKWVALLDGMHTVSNLNLQFPKFKLAYGMKGLKHSLSALGMEEIFKETADFSGIAKNLFISRVLHKAVVDVNEEGTEAAAVTIGEMTVTSVAEPLSFIANRPFLFVITDLEQGNILFMGKKIQGER